MNKLKNKVQLIGYLGGDPEIKAFGENGRLAKFSLATNESFKNAKGEKVQETQWHNLVAWNTTANFAEKYLKKGTEVAVEGKLVNRNYTAKDGTKKYTTEIEVNEVLIISKKNS
ncbi:MAG: single-stranded DNA-binding protein [Bacteroidia bacterium]|nr:single-stranded DNA-binding protein [Bacteroidia bacterium]